MSSAPARTRGRNLGDGSPTHADLPLFASPATMARPSDPVTSRDAASRVAQVLSPLQQRVHAAFLRHGPMTAKTAEQLAEFADLGFSTVRKRVSELRRAGRLADTGRTEAGCAVYEAAGCCRQEGSDGHR